MCNNMGVLSGSRSLSQEEISSAFEVAQWAIRKAEDVTAFCAFDELSENARQLCAELVNTLWPYVEEV